MLRRAPVARPYFFEIFTVVNFVIIQLLLWRVTRAPITTMLYVLFAFIPALCAQAAVGVLIRAAIAWRSGTFPALLRVIRTRAWLVDTVRIVIFSAFSVQTYCWIKLAIPLLHPRLFDQELWNLDRALLGGYSPNVLFINLFSATPALRFIDWSYASFFYASLVLASVYFASSPDRRVRLAFVDSNVGMWLIGAWLYVLVPSLGPAFRFPEVWLPLSAVLGQTQQTQRLLVANYQTVLQFAKGINGPVNILFGIAAFPSLHVAFEVLVLMWMRRLWRYGTIVFGIFTLVIFIGSIVTGWHYLVDGIGGAILAAACYGVAVRQYRIGRRRFFEHAPADPTADHAR